MVRAKLDQFGNWVHRMLIPDPGGRVLHIHGPVMRLLIIGYMFLAVGNVLAFYFAGQASQSIKQEREDRSRVINQYLAQQCDQDKKRDDITISVYDDISKLASGEVRHRLQEAIDQLRPLADDCKRDIPPVIVSEAAGKR